MVPASLVRPLRYIIDNTQDSVIIRNSRIYSRFGNDFVKTMLKLGRERDEISVIFDQVGTSTNAYDLALTILKILLQLENEAVETYHFSNEGDVPGLTLH